MAAGTCNPRPVVIDSGRSRKLTGQPMGEVQDSGREREGGREEKDWEGAA